MNFYEESILKIKVFGIIREKLKDNLIIIPLNNGSISLKALRKNINELYPYLATNEINFIFAVNKAICNKNIKVTSSDEIALIHPISGG
jgi:molybdopterin converting factor small subunit